MRTVDLENGNLLENVFLTGIDSPVLTALIYSTVKGKIWIRLVSMDRVLSVVVTAATDTATHSAICCFVLKHVDLLFFLVHLLRWFCKILVSIELWKRII